MKVCEIRNVKIGAGIPKICIPIVDENTEEIIETVRKIKLSGADLVEWRADFFKDIEDFDKLRQVLEILREILFDIPIIFTVRTSVDGGKIDIDTNDYVKINSFVLSLNLVDIIDIELSRGSQSVKKLIEIAKNNNVKTIVSNHRNDTPIKDEIVEILIKMQDFNPDIIKIALTPHSNKDVLTLLSAMDDMTDIYVKIPVIAISMTNMGVISRICQEMFCSSITFASLEKSSAPGQIQVSEMKTVLSIMHKAIGK